MTVSTFIAVSELSDSGLGHVAEDINLKKVTINPFTSLDGTKLCKLKGKEV
jgi:hypothetical protein